MRVSIRWFLVGVALLSNGYLARPVTAETEPETLSAWTGDPSAEPTALAPTDDVGIGASLAPAFDDGAAPAVEAAAAPEAALTPEAAFAPEVDLWAEFYTSPPPTLVKTEPARAAVASAPAPPQPTVATAASTYKVQQNDTVQR